MPLKGGLSTIKGLKAKILATPRTVAHAVTQRASPAMTALTQEAFASGQNVYGDARPAGASGRALTLERSGTTRAQLRFVANGTILRCVLGPKYTRFLIGKYGILPNGALPLKWSRKLGEIVAGSK